MIRILIVDDHPLVTDGIRMMVMPHTYLSIAGAARTGKEALDFLDSEPPVDVILLDINLPDMDGLRICELIREKDKTVKILGLTYLNEAGIITQLIRKGANGYLLKNMDGTELLKAIDEVMNGATYLSKAANEKIIQQLQHHDLPATGVPQLTRRERDILELLMKGLTSQEIATQLFLSSYTVDTHRKNMLQKFNVRNTQSLLNVVRNLGVLPG
ncbi:MAG: response regulator transcription factor [Candidatus Pseudobacter hemicellulosilyticus]|uniref:Response regulator transcription factor n=1 Tax=Candidatus Pseudobacter hemicellulosilyticus TaxID=3121375 RepID=A0AAJ5WUS4_9BACT|nr:MAG: response regulator transcription factor [Pseudobacter sp.]